MDITKVSLKKKRILVVDDELEILETVEDLLLDEVAGVDCAQSYDKAVALLERNFYDLAVFDLMGVRGLDLVRDYGRTVRCVVLTGQVVAPVTLSWLTDHGAKAYLPKPDIVDLTHCLRVVTSVSHSMELWNSVLQVKKRKAKEKK
ncbi:response regulator [Planctomycetota bacterium]